MPERILRQPVLCFSAAILWALMAPTVSAATGIKELDAGLARFALDTGENAASLRYSQALSSETALLNRAKALINIGNTTKATPILDQLVKGQYARGEAALLKAGLISDSPVQREELLRLAAKKGHGDVRQQALYELAETARLKDQPDRAGQVLASMDPGYWAALGYMNIASEYAKTDSNPSRALVALRVAMAMAEEDQNSERTEALKSQLLVRAGHLAFEHEDYDKAISFLEKVPLDSYSTPRGLYLHGLALSEKGNQRGAMQSWHRAKKYPLAHPGVAESWLGTGRGYDLSGYLGQAGEAYLAASASYESERVTLRKLAELVHEKGAYQALVKEASETEAQWFLADRRMLTQPISAYLLQFMEEKNSQDAVFRVTDLQSMLRTLQRQKQELKVFRSVLAARLNDGRGDSASAPAGFEEALADLARRIAKLSNDRPTSVEQAKELKAMSLTLKDLQNSVQKLPSRMSERDRKLKARMAAIDQALKEVARTTTRTEKTLVDANRDLDERVLAFVQKESERMVASLEKANQQIAHLYEYLALESLSRRAQ